MSFDEAPETLDTGAEPEDERPDVTDADEPDEEQDTPEEEPGEEQDEADEPEPERPAKKYAGQFETPEELEKAYFDANMRANKAERMAQQPAHQPMADPQKQFEAYRNSLFQNEFAVQKKVLGAYGIEDEDIAQLAINNVDRQIAIESRFGQQLNELHSNMAFQMDPRRQMFDQLAEISPTLKEHISNPLLRQFAAELVDGANRMNQERPNQPKWKAQQRPRGGNAGGKFKGAPQGENAAFRQARKSLESMHGGKVSDSMVKDFMKAGGR